MNECSPDELHQLGCDLARCSTAEERWGCLALNGYDDPSSGGSLERRILFAACRAAGQWELIAEGESDLIDQLLEVERFYAPIGGIVGYQAEALAHLRSDAQEEECSYSDPDVVDIRSDSPERREALLEGIRRMGQMAEIYPVGGVGDRLGLRNEDGTPLPVAALHYNGATLLSHLFRDLAAREALYRDLMGCDVTTPVVLMVSSNKGNREHILQLCEEAGWFGRPPDSFYFVVQPSVPVVTPEGQWVLCGEGKLLTRPGGHGVLWKVMEEQGAFDWLAECGRSHALVRQINNPLAATDNTLLALSGLGWSGGYEFGFATCPRRVGAAEGMVVSFTRGSGGSLERGISNIEYTQFASCQMEDLPEETGSPYSRYPANTNILFVDLAAVRQVAADHPFPGCMVNFSKKLRTEEGVVTGGRLETTMQNVADHLVVGEGEPLRAFATYGERGKTISVTKREYREGEKLEETPPGCYFDHLQGFHALMSECGLSLPEIGSADDYLRGRPGLLLDIDPIVGPLWSLVVQKVRGGALAFGSHLHLAMRQIDWEGVDLDGSLVIKGGGSLTLRNVRIRNRGVDWSASQPLWKGEPVLHETVWIEVEEGGSLHLEDLVLEGGRIFRIHKGEEVVLTPTTSPWEWESHVDSSGAIVLKKSVRQAAERS